MLLAEAMLQCPEPLRPAPPRKDLGEGSEAPSSPASSQVGFAFDFPPLGKLIVPLWLSHFRNLFDTFLIGLPLATHPTGTEPQTIRSGVFPLFSVKFATFTDSAAPYHEFSAYTPHPVRPYPRR